MLTYHEVFNTVIMHDLIKNLLNNGIVGTQSLLEWMKSRKGHVHENYCEKGDGRQINPAVQAACATGRMTAKQGPRSPRR